MMMMMMMMMMILETLLIITRLMIIRTIRRTLRTMTVLAVPILDTKDLGSAVLRDRTSCLTNLDSILPIPISQRDPKSYILSPGLGLGLWHRPMEKARAGNSRIILCRPGKGILLGTV